MVDSLGVREAALAAPEHLVAAAAAVGGLQGLPDADGLTSVLLVGAGAAADAANAATALVAEHCRLPVLASARSELPGFVGADTLVILLDAAAKEVAGAAAAVGARTVALPAEPSAHLPARPLAVGPLLVQVLSAMDRMGLVDGVDGLVGEAIAQVRRRSAELAAPQDVATQLARRVGRTLPIVYGGGALGSAAAWTWKHQLNLGPKVPAFANSIPELTHDEVSGWAQHGDVTRQVFSLVLLRHDHEHPRIARAVEAVEDACAEVVAGVHHVVAAGRGALAQYLDLVLVGQLVALAMAEDAGVDPGPSPVADEVRARSR